MPNEELTNAQAEAASAARFAVAALTSIGQSGIAVPEAEAALVVARDESARAAELIEAANTVVEPGLTHLSIPEDLAGGEVEVADAIHYFIREHVEADVFHFKTDALYWCENVLELLVPAGRTIRFEGHNATLQAKTNGSAVIPRPGQKKHLWPRTRKHIEGIGQGRLELVELTIQGAHPYARDADTRNYVEALEGQHAFDFDGLTGVVLTLCKVRDVYGDMVYLSGGVSNVMVEANDFDGCGRQGWAIVAAENVRYTANKLNHVGRSMFDIEPNSPRARVRKVKVDHNEFGINRLTWFAHGGQGVDVGDVELSDNMAASPMNAIIKAGSRPALKQDGEVVLGPDGLPVVDPLYATLRRGPYRILRNTGSAGFGSPQAMIRFDRVDGVKVEGNSHRIACGSSRGSTAVEVTCCTGIDVGENAWEGTWAKPAEKDQYPLIPLDESCATEEGSADWYAPVKA